MVYQWKMPIPKIDAQRAGEELERISQETGSLRPEMIVDASREKGAVLHGCFEWNDTVAAEGYRKHQAQDLLRNIVTIGVAGTDSDKPIRAFISIREEYIPIETVIASVDLTQEMMASALKELRAFRAKYSTLQQLAGIMGAIDQLQLPG